MTALSAAVMGHPLRRREIGEVTAALAKLDPTPVLDPDPLAARGTMRTARLAWAASAGGATHHVVVQDDCEPDEDLAAALPDLVAARPDAAIALYADWSTEQATACRLAALRGCGWAPVVDRLPVQGLVLPRKLALGLGEFLDTAVTRWEPYDLAALRYLRSVAAEVLVAVPHPVDRAPVPSLMSPGDLRPRRRGCPPAGPVSPPAAGRAAGTPEVLPHLSWREAKAMLVPTGPLRRHVPARPVHEVLLARGLNPLEVFLDTHDPQLLAHVGAGFVFELWLAGVAMSASYPATGPTRRIDPLAWSALGTVAPGGLSRFVNPDLMAEATQELTGVVCAGMRHGSACLDPDRPLSVADLAGAGEQPC